MNNKVRYEFQNFTFYRLLSTTSLYAQKKAEKQVIKAFENYKSALLNDKGEDALNTIDSRTLTYYDDMLKLVKTADSQQVSQLSVLDKVMVLSIRHRTPKEEILTFDNKSLFIYAVNQGMVGKSSVAKNEIRDVIIDGNFAKGKFIANGKETPFYFHFYLEDGSWKINLTSMFTISNMALKKLIEDSNQNENEFILSLLEMVSGKKPGSDVWIPVR